MSEGVGIVDARSIGVLNPRDLRAKWKPFPYVIGPLDPSGMMKWASIRTTSQRVIRRNSKVKSKI